MKILVISDNNLDKLMVEKSKWDVDWVNPFGKTHRVIRKIRNFWQKFNIPYFNELFSSISPKMLSKYDFVIVNEGLFYFEVLQYIRKYNKKCRLLIFFLNSSAGMNGRHKDNFLTTVNQNNCQKYNYEVWSFDKQDCKAYHLRYNNSYLIKFDSLSDNISVKYDVTFFGRDKGRLDSLKKIAKLFDKLNITYKLEISPDRGIVYKKEDKKFFMDDTIPYEDFLKKELEGNCMLELLLPGQHGITYRALEAQFYHRKLITNCSDIKKYEFYNESNIFLIGDRTNEQLKKFVEGSYQLVSTESMEKYQFDGWLKNFCMEQVYV